MNANNVIKIGTALKWRDIFDINKIYYQENIVTACGCVFRCKVLQTQGKSPITVADEAGHIMYSNQDIWDVVVDMLYYYNYALDNQLISKDILDYVKSLEKEIKDYKESVDSFQETANKKSKELTEEINKLWNNFANIGGGQKFVILNQKPSPNDYSYYEEDTEDSLIFGRGQFVAYPDNEMTDGWGFAIVKNIDVQSNIEETKVDWYYATEIEKRLIKLELMFTDHVYGVIGTGKWKNDFYWRPCAKWVN